MVGTKAEIGSGKTSMAGEWHGHPRHATEPQPIPLTERERALIDQAARTGAAEVAGRLAGIAMGVARDLAPEMLEIYREMFERAGIPATVSALAAPPGTVPFIPHKYTQADASLLERIGHVVATEMDTDLRVQKIEALLSASSAAHAARQSPHSPAIRLLEACKVARDYLNSAPVAGMALDDDGVLNTLDAAIGLIESPSVPRMLYAAAKRALEYLTSDVVAFAGLDDAEVCQNIRAHIRDCEPLIVLGQGDTAVEYRGDPVTHAITSEPLTQSEASSKVGGNLDQTV